MMRFAIALWTGFALAGGGAQEKVYPDMPAGSPPVLAVEGADASSAGEMRAYTDRIEGTGVTFDLLPIPGGRFEMGSQPGEPGRKRSEGPRREVEISPFWMGRCEVTWDEYRLFMMKLDLGLRKAGELEDLEQDRWADAVSRPTPPYVPMDFGMGVAGCPAICMTQFAARQYTRWLSMKTGRFYRLPTEAEWEYACRAGTTTTYSFGDDVEQLGEYAWYFDNSDDRYHEVGSKKPNPWGLYDMHGNVAEWVLDGYDKDGYRGGAVDPIQWPKGLYPRVVRGGSWDDDADRLRSAARRGSSEQWKVQDPQLPKSIWYHTDAPFLGFRIVRPLEEPSEEDKARYWEPQLDEIRAIVEKQRRGER
jgi:formylglycine-generating enzyme required for sulfatase activity